MKEKIIENKFNKEKFKSWNSTCLLIPKIETAARVGIDSKKESFAESTLLKFKNLAAVITIPDLLTPGIRDKIWKMPTMKAYL